MWNEVSWFVSLNKLILRSFCTCCYWKINVFHSWNELILDFSVLEVPITYWILTTRSAAITRNNFFLCVRNCITCAFRRKWSKSKQIITIIFFPNKYRYNWRLSDILYLNGSFHYGMTNMERFMNSQNLALLPSISPKRLSSLLPMLLLYLNYLSFLSSYNSHYDFYCMNNVSVSPPSYACHWHLYFSLCSSMLRIQNAKQNEHMVQWLIGTSIFHKGT